ncbi:MAG TPA: phosphatidate cytidylyltransferase [Tepidisphaeraceae bacterium]|jgi:phosphatidate cytidylyltransferase|nr:phosphatidate cytidylyltransferase [Tepidisphaeraceae bacterium]
MHSTLRQRLTYGSLMMAVLLALLYFDYWAEQKTRGWVVVPTTHPPREFGLAGVGLLLLLIIILPFAVAEVARLFVAENVRPYRFLAGLGSGLLVVHAFLTQFPWFQHIAASTLVFIIVFVMILAAIRRASGRHTQEAIAHMAGTVLAMLYLGGLAWFLMALRVKHSVDQQHGFQGSTQAVVMILLVVKFADIGAYFGGRAFGRHKLIAWLSPQKTWEGLVCGLATSALIGLACSAMWPHALSTVTWPKALLFGAIIGAVGQAGDLLESLMKRDAQVKDSGDIIPGFGGLLDVIDSPLLAAPAAYLLFSLF